MRNEFYNSNLFVQQKSPKTVLTIFDRGSREREKRSLIPKHTISHSKSIPRISLNNIRIMQVGRSVAHTHSWGSPSWGPGNREEGFRMISEGDEDNRLRSYLVSREVDKCCVLEELLQHEGLKELKVSLKLQSQLIAKPGQRQQTP